MESIPLPPFVAPMWAVFGVLLAACVILLLVANPRRQVSALEAALTPFAIPVGVTAFVVLVVSGLGVLLLTIGKGPAVPVALGAALLVLAGCSFLAAQRG